MHLLHNATIDQGGIIDIDIYIIDDAKQKRYVYRLDSEYAARRFHQLYRKGKACHGRALAVLNKFKIKGENYVQGF